MLQYNQHTQMLAIRSHFQQPALCHWFHAKLNDLITLYFANLSLRQQRNRQIQHAVRADAKVQGAAMLIAVTKRNF